jgi:mycofactocin system glycosyltransferase
MTATVLARPRRLPDGFTVRMRDDVRVAGSGRLLVGGSPVRVVKLTELARSWISDGLLTVDGAASELLAGRLLDGNLADPALVDLSGALADITVVIPVRDRPEQLDRCLAALRPLPCVVVDDQSLYPELVADVIARHGATLVSLPVNMGPAGARNAGLRRVATPYVAFVDSDVTVYADTISRLARHFADDRVALVGPRVRSLTSERPRWHERFDAHSSSLDLNDRGCSVRPGAAVAWLPGACLVGRVDRLGAGFADELRVGEDVDLVWRLVDDGYVVRYDPDETAGHDARSTIRGWLGRKVVYGTGGAVLAARHGDRTAVAALSPTVALAAAAILARGKWSLPVAGIALLRTRSGLVAELPDDPERGAVATSLACRGLCWAVRQEAALLLRHWWPAAAMAAIVSPTTRRLLVSAALVDLAQGLTAKPDPATAFVGRRLDDMAYGVGLWLGAARAGSWRCLRVRRPGRVARAR